jgi:acetyltransferase-like isoleucine patch superfamily enzyme
MNLIINISKKLLNYLRKQFYIRRRGVICDGMLNVFGSSDITIVKGATLKIGHNVTLNSDDKWYHARMSKGNKILLDRPEAEVLIGDNTRINGVCIHAYSSIKIGKNCLIAANVTILDSNGHSISFPDVDLRLKSKGKVRPVVIEDNVWVVLNSIVLPGVTIGSGSIISANSVVAEDVPPMSIYSSHSGRIVKNFPRKL